MTRVILLAAAVLAVKGVVGLSLLRLGRECQMNALEVEAATGWPQLIVWNPHTTWREHF